MQHVHHIAASTVPAAYPASGKPTDKWAFLLPSGWARFPTGAARRRELDGVVDEVVALTFPQGAPQADVESHRQVLRDSLRQAFSAAGAGAVYVPTQPMEGIAVPASIVETELFGVVGRSAIEVATSILGDAQESSPVDVDGLPGARLANTLRETPGAAGRPTAGTRQVTYVVARDEAGGDWLVLSFSAVWKEPGTERLAEVLVAFFDAVMATFRWTGPGADPVSLPERTVPGSA